MKLTSTLAPAVPVRPAAATFAALLLAFTLFVPLAAAEGPHGHDLMPLTGRNLDARISLNQNLRHNPSDVQNEAVKRLRHELPDAQVRFEPTTGATRSISRPVGYLTHELRSDDPKAVAMEFVTRHLATLGLEAADVEGRELTDEVVSDVTGATHVYWRQTLDGVPVYNGQLHVNLDRHGRVQSVNNTFVPNLARSANSLRPQLSGEEAVAAALESIGLDAEPAALTVRGDARQTTLVDHEGVALEPITAQLMLLPINQGNARLVWTFLVQTLDQDHAYEFNVDATSGKIWTRFDLVSDAAYRVYAQPDESPNHSSGRVLEADPQLAATNASPNGWHSTGGSSFTILRGNNAHAYHDRDGNNSPPASQPSSGTLNFDFGLNLGQDPVNYINAAVTNLFYWNNVIHDVQYQHGFTETAGNFQVNNFGRGGSGNDDVRAEAQDNADGSSRCNANFFTPTDGSRPRMQMFVCNNTNPQADGDLDNGVIVHEYGHGISIRQVGGPNNSSCLNNNQQGGEGWSDWFGLVYTAKSGDTGPQARGIGSYLFGLAPDGTIRPQRYSTSSSINNYTYQSIGGQAIPHGVGSVWAQAIWEVYWALVDEHGFDSNLYNPGSAAGAAGNTRALTYVNEGLKNTACSPTFLDARDGIIQAATNLHGGEDVCTIWEAFAAFGLGTNASTGGSNSTTATNGFNVPASCDDDPPPPTGECPAGSINFSSFGLQSYADQNFSNSFAILDGGDTLQLTANTWLRSASSFTVTADTVVEFEFASNSQGEIHSIGFDETNTLNDAPRHFQFWGNQNWTGAGKAAVWSPQYTGGGAFQTFTVPVGQFFTGGSMRLVFGNDKDSGTLNNEGRYRCVRVFEDDGGGGGDPMVLFSDDMETGAPGWTKTSGSTDLWRIATDCVTPASGAQTLAFSRASPNCDYDVGTAVGTVTTPLVNGSGKTSCTLEFDHFWQTESFNGDFDRMFIEASSNGGSSWSLLEEINARDANPSGYVAESYPVTCSGNMQFRFRFDSEDGVSNDFLGWYVDDVVVTGQ